MTIEMLLDGAALLFVLGLLNTCALFSMLVSEAIAEYREFRKSGKPLTKWGKHE